jgi:AcrR family transcriptional regulator
VFFVATASQQKTHELSKKETLLNPTSTSAGEATREAILAASYQLFSEQGYHGTSMRAIASRAGITAGSIYNHFADKEQIIQAVILRYHPLIRVLPHLSEAQGDSAQALIRAAAQRLAQEIEADPGMLRLVFVELIDLGGKHVRELAGGLLPVVQEFLEKVYASGEIARPRDPLIFFSAFVGMLAGYAFTAAFLPRMPSQAQSRPSLDEAIETFLWGVLSSGEKQ